MEVPKGVRWDRKISLEPNLHMCGEDDIKRTVYNMKGKRALREKDRNIKKTENTQKKTL